MHRGRRRGGEGGGTGVEKRKRLERENLRNEGWNRNTARKKENRCVEEKRCR